MTTRTTRPGPRAFLDDDFLLETDTAAALYHDVAARQPIIDYHCHLDPAHIASDHRFETMTAAWLDGDHYKWRALRTNGVPERLVTGDATPWEKFEAWAATVPYTLRNPLYHWTHLELRFPFGIRERLGPETALGIWERGNARLAEDGFSVQGLLRGYDVRVVCTTDDPTDDLDAHARHAAGGRDVRLLPTFRPDKALALDDVAAWNAWVDRLAAAAGVRVASFDACVEALDRRHAFFHARGGRLSDHGLEAMPAGPYGARGVDAAFAKARGGAALGPDEAEPLRAALLEALARMNHARGWAQQLHLGPMRNNNGRMRAALGADAGFDSIGDRPMARPLALFLDRLDRDDALAKTILYNLNPADNEVFATMTGNFQGGGVPGKIQWGSAWWFLDQKDGIERHLDTLSNMSLLSRFVGMLTDSRSFLSYSRHEYFRRILCNRLGHEVETGLLPADRALLDRLVADVCFGNARRYFGFDVPEAV